MLLIVHAKRTSFAVSKKKKFDFNQFSPESKEYHGHVKKSSFLSVVIVLYLNYRPNSAQIDSDIRGRSADENLGLSLWWEGRSLSHQKDLKGYGSLQEWGKLGSSPS